MKHAHQIGDKVAHNTKIIEHGEKDSIRLNKYISNSGYCSRREADRLIEKGMVKIDGVIAEMGSKVLSHQCVIVNGCIIEPKQSFVYIALHKPAGIICTTDQSIKGNIVEYLQYKEPVFPIGRLDRDTSGLILMTSDGDIVNKILRSSHQHEKEYMVTVNKKIDDSFIMGMAAGVKIYNPVNNSYQITEPCKIKQLSQREFRLILTQGLNRQIRRMCTAFDYQVVKLQRVRVMNVKLGTMSSGAWRYLTKDELFVMNEALKKE